MRGNRREFIGGGLATVGLLSAGGTWFAPRPAFGRQPEGARLKRIMASLHYQNGQFQKAFPGSNVYTADDFPPIDVLLLTHDHWDHLDYPSLMALRPKVRDIVCPLGVGAYVEQWGFDTTRLHEEDWFTEVKIAANLQVHVLPSQHFPAASWRKIRRSGRDSPDRIFAPWWETMA